MWPIFGAQELLQEALKTLSMDLEGTLFLIYWISSVVLIVTFMACVGRPTVLDP